MILVHCPNRDREIKGTKYIIEAVDSLCDEGYNIKLDIIENQPHDITLDTIKKSDVVIDQLLIGWYGMVAVEAWAMRKPVICYIRPDLYDSYDVPVCPANPNTIEQVILEFINFPNAIKLWGDRGYEYVKKVHDVRNLNL